MTSKQSNINKKQAKQPLQKGEWQAIDIYIFSNGQEYSPPRKYHLQASKLNLWDSTLDDLAKSHYGPFYSNIQLFTLDGRKIDGPLELRDGMPYVAVKTPDAFIDSGYAKYLIKASRSWEKRHAKKTSLINVFHILSDDEPNFKLNSQEITQTQENFEFQIDNETNEPKFEKEITQVNPTSELASIKTPDESLKEDSVFVQPCKLNLTKVLPSRGVSPNQILSANRPERKRISPGRTSIEKSPGRATRQTKKPPTPTKNTFRKKILADHNKPNNHVKTPATKSKTITKQLPSDNLTTLKGVTTEMASTQRLIEKNSLYLTLENNNQYQAENPSSQMEVTALNENITTDSVRIQSLINKTISGKVLDNNQYGAEIFKIKSAKLETSRVALLDEVPQNNEKIQTCIEQATREVNTTEIVSHTNSKIEVFPASEALQNDVVTCSKPIEHNCIGQINKGDVVNFSVKIDLQNGDQTQRSNTNEMRRVSSVMEWKKENVLKSNGNNIEGSKSLQSIISCVNDNYATVVVMQCGCCDNNKTVHPVYTMPVYKDENGFFVLMPNPVPGAYPCCNCELAKENNELNMKAISDKINTSLEDVPEPMLKTIVSCETQKVETAIPTAEAKESQTGKVYQAKTYDMRVVEKMDSTENLCCSESCDATSSQIVKKTNTVDSFTQTDWCAVLLEVKCHADGRYSFYLPPLEMLRSQGLA